MATFVLVHGAWHGGWCWAPLERSLRGCGHDVTSPTLTGLGERSHLASPDIVPDTHVLDIVNHIKWKDLEDVILVGHSYGGVIITGVAGRLPERIRALVYLDAIVPEKSGVCHCQTQPRAHCCLSPTACKRRLHGRAGPVRRLER